MERKLNYQLLIGMVCTLFVVGVALLILFLSFFSEIIQSDKNLVVPGYGVTNITLILIATILGISIYLISKSKKSIEFFQFA